MNRSRLEPLGVPGLATMDLTRRRHRAQEPSGLDRWLVKQITSRLGPSPVRIELWDEPEVRAARRHRAHADSRPQGAVAAARQSGSALRRSLQLGPRASARRPADAAARGLPLHVREHRDRPGAGARPEARARPVGLEAQHSSPLRHRQRVLQAVARPRGAAIHVRVFRRPRHDDRASAASEDASRLPQAAAQARRARRRGRRRLGRLRAVHGARTTACACAASTSRRSRSRTRARGQASAGSTAKSSSSRTTTAT